MQRAIYKPEVVAQWRQLLKEHDRKYGRYTLGCGIASALGLIAAALLREPAFLALFALGFTGVILLAHAGTNRLICPNCGKRPGSAQSSAITIDMCNHCHAWLKSPYASDQEPAV